MNLYYRYFAKLCSAKMLFSENEGATLKFQLNIKVKHQLSSKVFHFRNFFKLLISIECICNVLLIKVILQRSCMFFQIVNFCRK